MIRLLLRNKFDQGLHCLSSSGEIDPNAETKPARPDPIDMDEDGKTKCLLE